MNDERERDFLNLIEDDERTNSDGDDTSTGTGSTQSSGFYERGLRSSLRDDFFQVIHTFRVENTIGLYVEFILYVFFSLQYISVALSSQYPWSNWFNQVARALESTRSFGFHYVAEDSVSAAFIAFVAINVLWSLITAWVVRKEIITKEHIGKRLQKLFIMSTAVASIVSVPTAYISAKYINCSGNVEILSFGEYSCFSGPHVAFFVFSLLMIPLNMLVSAWSMLMFCCPSPKKVNVTTQQNPKLLLIVCVTNIFFQTLLILLPSSLLWLVSGSMLLCDAYLMYEMRNFPFYFTSSNAFFSCFVYMRILFSVFSVISQIIGFDDQVGQDVADGIMIGLFLPLGGLGFGITALKQRKIISKVLKDFSAFRQQHQDEDEADSALDSEAGDTFKFSVNSSEVEICVRLTMHRNAYEESARFILDKSNEYLKHKNHKLLLLYATYMMYQSGETVGIAMASHLISRAERQHPPLLDTFIISLRRHEMESMQGSNANLHDLHRYLTATRKKQLLAKFYIRQFWRALLRESVNVNTMLKNIRLVDSHSKDAKEMYLSLMRKFPDNALVLRSYAAFLEDIEHDTKESKEMIQKADSIEIGDYGSSQHHQFHQSMFDSNRNFSRSSRSGHPSFQKQDNYEESNLEESEEESNTEEGKTLSEQRHYRKALSRGVSLRNFKLGSVASVFFLLCVNLIIMTIGIYYFFDQSNDRLKEQEIRCSIVDKPYSAFSEFRNYYWTQSQDSIESAFQTNKQDVLDILKKTEDKLSKAVPVKSSYDSTADKIWVSSSSPVFLPIIEQDNRRNFTYEQSEDSLFNMVQSYISHMRNILNQDDNNLNIFSYDFIYLWLNTGQTTKSLSEACKAQANELQDGASDYVLYVIIMACIVGVIFLADIITVFIILWVVHKHQFDALELFKLIPKNPISLIVSGFNYDEFSQLSQKDFETSRTLFEIPPWAVLLFWFIIAVAIQAAISGFLFFELIDSQHYTENMSFIVSAMSKAFKNSAQINFVSSELYSNMPYPTSQMIEVPSYELDQNEIQDAKITLNELRFGSSEFQGLYFLEPDIGSEMHSSRCQDTVNLNCLSFDSLMREILLSSSGFVEIPSEQTLRTFQAELFSTIEIAEQNLQGNYSEIPTTLVDRTINTHDNRATIMHLVFWLSVPVSTAILLFGLRRSVSQLETQGRQIRYMLAAIPLDVIESVPAIKQFVLTGKNLTEQHFEKIKKISAIRTESILAAAVDAVLVMDEKSHIDMFNHSAELMFGREKSEVIGHTGDELFAQNYRDQVQQLIKHLVNKKKSNTVKELRGIRKDGSEFPILVSMSIGVSSSGKTMIAAFCRDITVNKKHEALLSHEMKRAEELLLNIFPKSVTERLKNSDTSETEIRDAYEDVTCLIADIVSFTKLSSSISSGELVRMLNELVNEFDDLTQKNGVEKIKTIGDAYFCVGGAPEKSYDHPQRIIEFALGMLQAVSKYNERTGKDIKIRIGIHTGPVIAGVFGLRKVLYDVLGDTVTITNLMESTGEPGKIQCSRNTYERVHDLYSFEERVPLNLKDKGSITRYLLIKKKEQSGERLDLSAGLGLVDRGGGGHN